MIKLFNTLSSRKESFKPLDPGHIRLYCCGPTVYDRIHAGNARPLVVFDVLTRLLRHYFPRVTYVRNITDIDDKINQRASERGITITRLTEETTRQFHADCRALGCLPPDREPRATNHIEQIQAMISTLVSKGQAYFVDAGTGAGHVLFSVGSAPDYGALSGRTGEEARKAGARIEVASYKKNPADFILWKPSSADEPGWESAWGFGRPGWHVECSAMSTHYLGPDFDIHAGGLDLIFPHHENEIAQSKGCYPGSHFARYWLHNGYITSCGEKMSKSLGNFHTVGGVLESHHGETLRLALLQAHYRQPLDFCAERLEAAQKWLERLYQSFPEEELPAPKKETPEGEFEKKPANAPVLGGPVLKALCDDLNTPEALSVLSAQLAEYRKAKEGAKKKIWPEIEAGLFLLGIGQLSPSEWFGREEKATTAGLSVPEIDVLISARNQARKEKDFAQADEIREKLDKSGILLEDGVGGTIWKRQ